MDFGKRLNWNKNMCVIFQMQKEKRQTTIQYFVVTIQPLHFSIRIYYARWVLTTETANLRKFTQIASLYTRA